jgi:hypothetical protein
MRTCRSFLAAAFMFGGVIFVMPAAAQNSGGNALDRAADRTGDALRRAGDRISGSTTQPADKAMAPDVEDIRETLREVTDAALTKGGFDDLVERFVDADRNRLGKDNFPGKDHPQLDGRIAQFQKDWESKYNQAFKIKDKEAVFNMAFARIIQSEVPEGARLAGEKQTTVTESGKTVARDENNKVAGGNTNREPGRNIATVTIAASHGLPEINVPMVHEFPDRWKIDVPDDYSAQQLHDNLLKHLTMADEQRAQWPGDANEAYRIVSHHVLAAIMNADAQPGAMGAMHQPGQPMGTGTSGAGTGTGTGSTGMGTGTGTGTNQNP